MLLMLPLTSCTHTLSLLLARARALSLSRAHTHTCAHALVRVQVLHRVSPTLSTCKPLAGRVLICNAWARAARARACINSNGKRERDSRERPARFEERKEMCVCVFAREGERERAGNQPARFRVCALTTQCLRTRHPRIRSRFSHTQGHIDFTYGLDHEIAHEIFSHAGVACSRPHLSPRPTSPLRASPLLPTFLTCRALPSRNPTAPLRPPTPSMAAADGSSPRGVGGGRWLDSPQGGAGGGCASPVLLPSKMRGGSWRTASGGVMGEAEGTQVCCCCVCVGVTVCGRERDW